MGADTNTGRVLMVGAGKMGGALIESWLKKQTTQPSDIVLVEPNVTRAKYFRDTYTLYTFETPEAINTGLGEATILFAVKPQVMDEVVPLYKPLIQPGRLVLSIAAGTPISYFEHQLGANTAVVRAMPNTPASIGHGITVLCANTHVSAEQRARCEILIGAVGQVEWIEDESLMDAVTAVSGSGPAYVFLLIEALAQAGISAGLAADLANRLALTTVAGAGALAEQTEDSPTVLRQNVTSPGGTTAAALEVLMADDGLQQLMARAVTAAKERGRELAIA
ncbi:MAG TPA: pyrroline-5-carboxylate reductase [Alphaproteobacteria bacterium]|nr:MAG: Pyrroline-5-carboxylate reductase [Alphaproteobacteria bacterium MarineAlpha9_Bin5]PPR36391.1 MAG: Pyrroline-5-carboxylate reductase [Alphaproteobacteria bacterium MarineAlpha9_Bin6]HHZ68661.1 pyrroline-5-carboxylate reductase [Alphaproteobacteria bacterium]HIA21992.1 pyrroline-5-carboxylate reductase [Alphaproteobacteria bacterium]HIB19838.1 pyrroline-5-carboxylate reductase [Alphaproteobacteria bacterium]